jgi:hypothetical protein
MSPETLAAAGEALFGERWQSALARELDVADRTVRRWAAGDSPIPDGLASDLYSLLFERQGELIKAMQAIEEEAALTQKGPAPE